MRTAYDFAPQYRSTVPHTGCKNLNKKCRSKT